MTVNYLDLADYIGIASEITGLDEAMVIKIANLDLADSALHAPLAGFEDEDFYRTSWTRQPCWSSGWRRTIRCPMATSAWHGWRFGIS